nr:radical SAM protein [Streptomyces sp. NBC_00899]
MTSRAGEVARIQEAWCAARGTEEGVPVPPALLVDVPRLQALLGQASGDKVIVSGTLERRLLLLQAPGGGWVAADLSGLPHAARAWPRWVEDHLRLERPDSWLSWAELDDEAVRRLSRPAVLVAALYRPEVFPLPRFPLGISDLARAARSSLTGQVELADMQLGVGLDDLVDRLVSRAPDILGISATFGQHDLMIDLLDAAFALDEVPLVLAGGSLTARNERLLLERYPQLLVARGAGEATMQDVLAFWHGEIKREHIRGVGYIGSARGAGTLPITRRSARPVNRAATDIFPELDLLPATLARSGVAQLETSRGCTNSCSFCPRDHKGQWAGVGSETLPELVTRIGEVFEDFPDLSRTLYLVDEEFIGRGQDAVPRALGLARTLAQAGFTWETSCRIDQVVNDAEDQPWHVARAQMWRDLLGLGLRRCLFGVESGVDSILGRFRKETTGEQNAAAIRTLSALGVPTRYTYITFDQLMSMEELVESFTYQGRTDLLLKPLPHLSSQQIIEGVSDPAFVAEHATGLPFYTSISYMLVSMECLVGAAYTRQAERAGLTGQVRPSMGRVDASFADWRIGVCSHWAQRWVDRSFSLDYTLKSLEKILVGPPRHTVRETRVILKDAAYTVFRHMLCAARGTELADTRHEVLRRRIGHALDVEIDVLRTRLGPLIEAVTRVLPPEGAATLLLEYRRWEQREGWELINADESCST